MVRVAGLASAEQRRGAVSLALEERQRAALADADSAPLRREGLALSAGQHLEAVEAAQRGVAERVHAADQGRVAGARLEQALRAGKDLAARRAGRREDEGGAAQPGLALEDFEQRRHGVLAIPVEALREAARLAPAVVGALGLGDAARRGAEHDGHALAAPPARRGGDGRPQLLEHPQPDADLPRVVGGGPGLERIRDRAAKGLEGQVDGRRPQARDPRAQVFQHAGRRRSQGVAEGVRGHLRLHHGSCWLSVVMVK